MLGAAVPHWPASFASSSASRWSSGATHQDLVAEQIFRRAGKEWVKGIRAGRWSLSDAGFVTFGPFAPSVSRPMSQTVVQRDLVSSWLLLALTGLRKRAAEARTLGEAATGTGYARIQNAGGSEMSRDPRDTGRQEAD